MKYFLVGLLLSCLLISNAQTIVVPYSNSFDNLPNDTIGWSHHSESGIDDWQIGTPDNGTYFSSAFSTPNAWGTNLTGNFEGYSNRWLETPYFDLTNTSQRMAFSIDHKVRAGSSGNIFKIEYKVGSNGVWQLLDGSVNKKNWQNSSGFTNYYTLWKNSAIDLYFLQGQDSVKFRFRLNSQYSNGFGWLIDNFKILPEYNNIVAIQGDTIRGINSYFTNFTIVNNYQFTNQWSNSYGFTDRFYFSEDNILDDGDQLLGEKYHSLSSSYSNWSNTFPLPINLSPGEYYIFYEYDVLDVLTENNESDNINFAVLIIDKIYEADYTDDFDSTFSLWNSSINGSETQWKRGDPNNWHVENPRSGVNAWLSGEQVTNQNYLESPYLDLSNSTNTSICWWYKSSRGISYDVDFYLQKPALGNSSITFPQFYNYTNINYNKRIPNARYYGWDCHCENVSTYDGEQSTKFRFFAFGNTNPTSLSQVLIDDIYIGKEKSDAGIGGEIDNRFTSSSFITDTLTYLLFNSGLEQLPPTTTRFYWSNDSILDSLDVLLGSHVEPIINDTTFIIRAFEYSKPTLAEGEYFILYELDSENAVDEMREYDNIGYFRINQSFQGNLPYFNDFETTIQGWRHSATLGKDSWEWDVPSGTILNTAFSGEKAFFTNIAGPPSWKSRMHLYTPIFDLTQLSHPVMEFDLHNYFSGYEYVYWPFNMGNMMYSVDGGNSWHVLETQSESYKNWYSVLQFISVSGDETIHNPYGSPAELLYTTESRYFRNYLSYQGRDYDDNTHFVLDLAHLNNEKQIQFMFVYANHDAPVEGMLLDNFEIKEASIDLKIPSNKKLMVSSADKQLKTYFKVKNDENYLSDMTSMKIYLSIDSLLDETDVYIHTESIPGIRPYCNHLVNLSINTPSNYGQYNYLIYELDPTNLVFEVDESNNVGHLDLAMDSASNYNYPILFDFEDNEIDGWTWWHDSTGFRHGHRFRHQTVIRDHINEPEDGIWFLDGIDLLGMSSSLSHYPTHHLEPPAFDFSNLSVIEMTFDYRSVGTYNTSYNSQGGNFSYSIDGGDTWIVLDYTHDIGAQNWYTNSAIESLGGQPGWGYKPDWNTAKYNLSFLAGQPNVRFRFNWKATYRPSPNDIHGFRLDNFKIDGQFFDLKAIDDHPTIILNSTTQPSFSIEYGIENNSQEDILSSVTNFYWSTDTIYDGTDILLFEKQEGVFNANTTFTGTQTINYPTPIITPEYYVLYFIDSDSTIHESDETNNLGWWKIKFTDSLYIDLESNPVISPIFTTINLDWFNFEFNFVNNGTIPSDSSSVTIHWSSDQVLDNSDVLLFNFSEPELLPSDLINHSNNISFPELILQSKYYLLISTDTNNENIESDETNNFVWVEVNIDTTELSIDEISTSENFTFKSEQHQFTLTYNGDIKGPITIVVQNSLGQVIIEENKYISEEKMIHLQKPFMSPGLYYFTIKKDNLFHIFKFVHH